ncbi:MAG: DUF5655 domain-containing protein [Bacteroidota bacterium]
MEKGVLEKTGKPLDYWVKVVKDSKIEKHGEIIKFLKSDHNFSHGFANFVALKSRAADAASSNPESLIENQYTKGKEHLKPIYELIISKVKEHGSDIEIVPKKANVSIRRKRQFLLIQPSTKTRMDLGLKLNNSEPRGILRDSGRFGAMCSNSIEIHAIKDVDDSVLAHIKQAYEDAV